MSWLAKSVAEEAKQSPTVIKKTKYVCLSGSKPFEFKVIKKFTKLQITLFQRKGIQYFTMKEDWQLVLQVIYFVYKCEAMFSTQRLKISKCTWIKRLLETTFASSVKPTINLRKNNLNNTCVTKNCHAKNRSRFTFNIIIIKNHEQPRRYMVHNYPLVKLSTATEEHIMWGTPR